MDLIQSPRSREAREVTGLALRSYPVSTEMAVKQFLTPSQVNLFKNFKSILYMISLPVIIFSFYTGK